MTHIVTLDIDWVSDFHSSHIFCSMPIEQVIDLRKVRTNSSSSEQIFQMVL